jgi:hypothetical protein
MPPKRSQGLFGLSGTAMTTIIRCVVSFGRATHALSGAVIRPTIYISLLSSTQDAERIRTAVGGHFDDSGLASFPLARGLQA